MTTLRMSIDIILEDTPANRTKLRTYWDNFKTDRALFTAIRQTNETSFVTLQECGHDDVPITPCVAVRKIDLNTVTREDAF